MNTSMSFGFYEGPGISRLGTSVTPACPCSSTSRTTMPVLDRFYADGAAAPFPNAGREKVFSTETRTASRGPFPHADTFVPARRGVKPSRIHPTGHCGAGAAISRSALPEHRESLRETRPCSHVPSRTTIWRWSHCSPITGEFLNAALLARAYRGFAGRASSGLLPLTPGRFRTCV